MAVRLENFSMSDESLISNGVHVSERDLVAIRNSLLQLDEVIDELNLQLVGQKMKHRDIDTSVQPSIFEWQEHNNLTKSIDRLSRQLGNAIAHRNLIYRVFVSSHKGGH
jgi:hypothetical protein